MPLTDWHCHLLPGIDDGAGSLDESLAMARQLANAGFRRVYCTPHCIRGCYDTTADQVDRAVAALQKEVTAKGIELELLPGMEYYLDEHFPALLEAPRPLGDSGLLLVEAPSQAPPDLIRENVFLAVRKGFTPLFAHPERCGWLAPETHKESLWSKARSLMTQNSNLKTQTSRHLTDLQKMGCRFQANLGSFTGFYGSKVAALARRLEAVDIYRCFGSDGHNNEQLKRILRPDSIDMLARPDRSMP